MELAQTAERFAASTSSFDARRHMLDMAHERLTHGGAAITASRATGLAAQAAALDALSPLKVLARGYAIAYGPHGVATSVADAAPGDELRVRLADGDILGTVASVEPVAGA